jgi:acetyl esterase/lipase
MGWLEATSFAAEPQVVNLWPAKPPGEMKELPPEQDLWNDAKDKPVGDRKIIKLTNVSIPTLTIYQPAPEKATGTAVIICPGGGHHILAFDHEGTEAAEWLASLGVTGIVLKYRVPARSPEKRWEAAVQDAQRAVSFVRSQAAEWKLDASRIGVLGFSAGGETAGLTALFLNERTYASVDAVDQAACRPDFAMLLYPGGFVEKENLTKLRDYVKVSKETPPIFMVHAYNDNVPVQNCLALALELKRANVSTELHMYATGGHGYGMRQTGEPVNHWPQRAEDWLRKHGWLKK